MPRGESGKADVISFKATADLVEAMRGVPNRSEFIRAAILAALENACPLCRGSGILTPRQVEHWQRFSETHQVQECHTCHEFHILCQHEGAHD